MTRGDGFTNAAPDAGSAALTKNPFTRNYVASRLAAELIRDHIETCCLLIHFALKAGRAFCVD